MSAKGSATIRKYLFRDVFLSTIGASIALSVILLYANLSKHDEVLLEAMSVSPGAFIELVCLMFPYALSMGLPFGFCLAALFCVGRWSAGNEITALHSLGFPSWSWQSPVFLSAFVVSILCWLSSLVWAPIARANFDFRKKEIAWNNLGKIVRGGTELELPLGKEGGSRALEGLSAVLGGQSERAVLTVGHASADEWRNLRIILLDDRGGPLSVLHAKRADVHYDRSGGNLSLALCEVDVDRLETSQEEEFGSHTFLSFEKWKEPLAISLHPEVEGTFQPKRVPVYLWADTFEPTQPLFLPRDAWEHLNKSLALGSSPFFLSFALIPLGVLKGRRERTANLFWGVLACLIFYLLGFTFSSLIGGLGFGWWVPSLLIVLSLFYKTLKINTLWKK